MIFGQVTLPNLFEPVPACDPLSGEVVLAPLRRQHMGAEAGHRPSEDRRVRAAHVQGAGNRACGEDRPVVKGSVWKERPSMCSLGETTNGISCLWNRSDLLPMTGRSRRVPGSIETITNSGNTSWRE